MEKYEKTDKTWWWATDFMYKHLLSTGQSWSHVQKLEFVTNLSELLKRIQSTATVPPAEPEPQPAPQFDAENVKQLIGNLMGSVYYKATINDWFVESQKRAAEIVENDKHALLAALGIE